jgi:hypothetical protein
VWLTFRLGRSSTFVSPISTMYFFFSKYACTQSWPLLGLDSMALSDSLVGAAKDTFYLIDTKCTNVSVLFKHESEILFFDFRSVSLVNAANMTAVPPCSMQKVFHT